MDVLLSKKGVEVGPVDNKGDTPLHLAAAQGHPMCAFNLTKAEPRGCLKANKAGQSPLDMAVACDRGEASAHRAPLCSNQVVMGSTLLSWLWQGTGSSKGNQTGVPARRC